MFEVFCRWTNETEVMATSEEEAWEWIYKDLEPDNWDVRLSEDRWPEYETVMEMEKYQ